MGMCMSVALTVSPLIPETEVLERLKPYGIKDVYEVSDGTFNFLYEGSYTKAVGLQMMLEEWSKEGEPIDADINDDMGTTGYHYEGGRTTVRFTETDDDDAEEDE